MVIKRDLAAGHERKVSWREKRREGEKERERERERERELDAKGRWSRRERTGKSFRQRYVDAAVYTVAEITRQKRATRDIVVSILCSRDPTGNGRVKITTPERDSRRKICREQSRRDRRGAPKHYVGYVGGKKKFVEARM